jgi:hypothetical protein
VGEYEASRQQLVLPKSTMWGTNSMPLAAPIGAFCLLQDKGWMLAYK